MPSQVHQAQAEETVHSPLSLAEWRKRHPVEVAEDASASATTAGSEEAEEDE